MPEQAQTSARPGALQLWWRRACDIVWPRNCPFCGCPLSDTEPGILCPDCLASTKLIEPPFCRQCASPFTGIVTGETLVCGYCQDLRFYFSRAIAACRAEGVVRDCILRFKYQREIFFGTHTISHN
jgi:predicted amidophosphoribosyltransferase